PRREVPGGRARRPRAGRARSHAPGGRGGAGGAAQGHRHHGGGDVIEVVDLERSFGALRAVDRVSFSVGEGEIFGFRGPNGAGQATTIKTLSTRLRPSGGGARVAGHDVVREPAAVRHALGLLFQDPAIDDRLTGRENLELHARIYGVPRRERAGRIDEAPEWIDLASAPGGPVRP